MKKNTYLVCTMLLSIVLTGFNSNSFSQGNGPQGPFFQFGGNNSSLNVQRLGLKTNSNLSLITADTARMDITKEGDVKIKKDFYLEKFPGLQNEKRLTEITPGGRLQPLANVSETLRGFIYAEPIFGDPILSLPCNVNPFWATKPDVMYLVEASCDGARVGIGTDNPVQKLDVRGNSCFSGKMGIGTTAPIAKLAVHQSSNTEWAGYFENNGGKRERSLH